MIRRGTIAWIDLDPAKSSEANKKRPCVIVSNEGATRQAFKMNRGTITIVPLTKNIKKVYSFQVFISAQDSGLLHDSKAQAEQVRSVSITRLVETCGDLSYFLMEEIDQALKTHLGLH